MTTSIRSGSADGALQLNGVDQITMQATQVLLAKPIAAPVGATGQLVTFDQVGGLGQTWQAVTRVAGTTYTNTTGKTIFANTQVRSNVASTGGIVINGVIIYGCYNPNVNVDYAVTGIIPNGATYYYITSGGTATITSSQELR